MDLNVVIEIIYPNNNNNNNKIKKKHKSQKWGYGCSDRESVKR